MTPDPGPWAWGSLEGRQSSREYSCEPPPPNPQIQSIEALEPHQGSSHCVESYNRAQTWSEAVPALGGRSAPRISTELNKREGFPGIQMVNNLPAMQETPVRFLGREDSLEKASSMDRGTWRATVYRVAKSRT